jgi:hypothetical protein
LSLPKKAMRSRRGLDWPEENGHIGGAGGEEEAKHRADSDDDADDDADEADDEDKDDVT